MRSHTVRVLLFFLAGVGPLCAAAPNPLVVLETNAGDITLELYPNDAPVTVDNFLGYVNSGFYDYLLFHRVIKNFMIQGGGFYIYEGTFYRAQPSDPIINESTNGLKNLRGTIAMARTAVPDSATSEFYINHIDNPHLDRENAQDGIGYCVFGKIVDGMGVLDSIANVPTTQYSQPNPPLYFEAMPQQLVGMYSATVLPCDVSYCSDLSGSGRIGFEDFALFALQWLDNECGSAEGFCQGADMNFSGSVDMADLDLFWEHWNHIAGYEIPYSDLSADNVINFDDLGALMEHWLDTGCDEANGYCGGADINHSGTVDLTDYSVLTSHWLGSY